MRNVMKIMRPMTNNKSSFLKLLAIIFLISTMVIGVFSGCGIEEEKIEEDEADGSPVTEEWVEESKTVVMLDTRIDIIVQAENLEEAENAIAAVEDEIDRLEGLLSRHREGSEVKQINENAGISPVSVSDETWEVVHEAVEVGKMLDGYLDITIAPILQLWGFGEDRLSVPDAQAIEDLLPYVDLEKIELDPEEQSVYLPESQMKIDLGGVSKGYILDQASTVFEDYNVHSAMIDAGDILTTEENMEGRPWRIGITHPRKDDYFGVVELSGDFLATSGDYERYFEEDGERYHHIMDPYTGRPTEGIISATVYSENSLQQADLLSTAAFGYGLEDSLALLEEMNGVEAVLIDSDGEYHMTPGFDQLEIREAYRGQTLQTDE